MRASSKINKIIKTSPEVLIKKAFWKAYGTFEYKNSRKNDIEASTYSNFNVKLSLAHSIIDLPNPAFLEKNKNSILSLAELSLKHNFNLLYKDYLNANYESLSPGRDGITFKSDIKSHDQVLHKINNSNQLYSKKLASKFSANYKPIDWQKDTVSGFRWSESTWYKDISYGHTKGVDVKVPWELARMQDLPNLAFAYKLDPKIEYIVEFQDRIFDFYSTNPPRYGVQWKTAMDVGIRAVNCIATYQLFRDIDAEINKKLDLEFDNIFKDFLYNHIKFIDENNEFSEGQRGNHYLTNLVSILLITPNFEQNNYCNHLIDKYSTAYFNELSHQFYEDGGNFEASLPYHLLGAELVLIAYNYYTKLDSNNKHLKTAKKKILNLINEHKLNQIIDFSLSNIHSGYIPKIGDHDSGRYFSIFSNIHFYYNFFFQANAFLNLPDYFERSHITSLINSVDDHKNFESKKLKIFKKSGFAVFKNQSYETTVSFPGLGQAGKGGHNHNDFASFVLSIHSRPFIVDPGTYCYTSNWELRNNFRSTPYHNTLSPHGIEQNIIRKDSLDDLFWLFAKGDPFSVSSGNTLKTIFRYYKKPHIRTFQFYPEGFLIIDSCEISKPKKISFHCHPKINLELNENSVTLSRDGIQVILKSDSSPKIEDFFYSPQYGTKIASKRIIFEMPNSEMQTEIEFK